MLHEHVNDKYFRGWPFLWVLCIRGGYGSIRIPRRVSIICQHVLSDMRSACCPLVAVSLCHTTCNDRTSPLSVICLTVGANVTPAISLCLSLIPYFRFNYDNSPIAMPLATIVSQTGISTPHPAKFNFFTLMIIWDLISCLIKRSLRYQLEVLTKFYLYIWMKT